jgi:mRNA turnover protein 4
MVLGCPSRAIGCQCFPFTHQARFPVAVSLTKVKTNRRALKTELVDTLREAVDKYDFAYVVSFDNMRTQLFKEVRTEWADSRFFLGKNKVMQLSLGAGEEDEYRPGLATLASDLVGNVGLLLTSRPPAEVRKYFDEYEAPDYARAGFVAPETISLSAGAVSCASGTFSHVHALSTGPLPELPHTMAEPLRKLGLPVRLNKGVVELTRDHDLCAAGDTLTPEQARLLKQFGHKTAVFRLHLLSSWERATGKYTTIAQRSARYYLKGGSGDGEADGSDGAASDAADEDLEAHDDDR